jgi:endonuclease YncB( thermonuclease family)
MALLVCLDRGVVGPRWTARLSSPPSQQAEDLARYHDRSFDVARVIDGDTVVLDVPDGTSPVTKIRLLGIDAPESGQSGDGPMYFADEATALARRSVSGERVIVYLDRRHPSRGMYGRLLAYIELPDGAWLNERMLAEGCAYADLRFGHGYLRRYQQLESRARTLEKGLWASVTREQLPVWLQRMRPELLATDPDGRGETGPIDRTP